MFFGAPSKYRVMELFGIPIYLDTSFAILLLLFVLSSGSFQVGLTHALILALSVLLHEFGHSLTARAFGYRTNDITISLLGGCASLIALPRKGWQEFLTALAGPLVSFLLSASALAVSWLVEIESDWLNGVVAYTFWLNLMLGGFNLLPGFPLDGGRIFRSVMSAFISRPRATLVAMWVGRAFAVLLALSWLVPAVLRCDLGAAFLLASAVLWLMGGRILPLLLRPFMPPMRAQLFAMTAGPVLTMVFAILGWHFAEGSAFGVVRILIAWMIWKEGYREYQLARMESSWTYQDFRAHVSPPPYGGSDDDCDVSKENDR